MTDFPVTEAGTVDWPGRDAARAEHARLQELHRQGPCPDCHPARYLFELMAGRAVVVRKGVA